MQQATKQKHRGKSGKVEPQPRAEPAVPPRAHLTPKEALSLEPGRGCLMLSKGQRVAVFNVDGKFYALDDACPHEGAPLSLGRLDRHILTCRVHEWEFDVTTGECLTCPSKPVKTYCVAKELTRLRIRPRKALRRT